MSAQPRHSDAERRPLRRRNIVDRGSGGFGPTMTPMVDVVLVILIFFMASTTIAGHEWFLRASLPEEHKDLPREPESRFVLPAATLRVEVFERNGADLVSGLGDQDMLVDDAVEIILGLDEGTSDGVTLLIAGADEIEFQTIMRLHDAAASISMRVAIE